MNNNREICIDLFTNKDEKSPFENKNKIISSQISVRGKENLNTKNQTK